MKVYVVFTGHTGDQFVGVFGSYRRAYDSALASAVLLHRAHGEHCSKLVFDNASTMSVVANHAYTLETWHIEEHEVEL